MRVSTLDRRFSRSMGNESILHEAHRLVHGDRGMMYGHPLDDMSRTAGMLSHLLADKLKEGVSLDARDVAMVMVCVKLSRERNHPKRDNRVDGAGYFECLDEIIKETDKRKSTQMKLNFPPPITASTGTLLPPPLVPEYSPPGSQLVKVQSLGMKSKE